MSTNRNTGLHALGTAAPPPHQPGHVDLIRQSHARCAAFGLTRIERPDHAPLLRGDLSVARERNQRLFVHAAPVMEMLFEQIVDTGSMIVLTDAHGTILHTVGDDDFLQRAGKVALAPGVNWAEHSKGTNAIGTALFEERPTLVHAGEHFMHANDFLTCSAAPIFDPRGNMLGVLDVSGDRHSYHQHTMGLVRMSARMIENHWLSDDCSHRLRLHFHSRAEFIGTLLEGIVAVDAQGRILGANLSALDQLAMSGVSLRGHTLGSLFGTSVAAVHDHFRAVLAPPMRLRLPNGVLFHASARFEDNAPTTRNATQPRPPIDTPAPLADAPVGTPQFARTGDTHIEALLRKAQRVVELGIPLLVVGEAGTGKELLARAAHESSSRARRPFVTVDCATVSELHLEALLAGTEANRFAGTLCLDEIAALAPALQTRLLRLLQERSGAHDAPSRPANVALVCTTRRDLREMIGLGQFNEDLYYRLNGLVLRLPPLRERADLEALVPRLLEAESAPRVPGIDAAVMDLLARHHWPGNVRQLASVLRTAAALARDEDRITEEHLSDDLREDLSATASPAAGPAPATGRTLDEIEAEAIRAALAATGGNVSEAAKQLGVGRNTIYRKLRAQPAPCSVAASVSPGRA